MKIVSLEASNVMRLRAVHITPGEDGAVVIGGNNAQGKTSVIESIQMALAGGKSIPGEPIRRGEKNASIRIDLGEFVVTRTFTPNDSKLTVATKDGAKYGSPQAILDGFLGTLTFDPLDFLRMAKSKPKEALEVLRNIAGVDTAEMDANRQQLFAERTDINRDLKAAQAVFDAAPRHDDAPDAEVSAGTISAKIAAAHATNADHIKARAAVTTMNERGKTMAANVKEGEASIADMEKEIQRLTEALAQERQVIAKWKEDLAAFREEYTAKKSEADALVDLDIEPLNQELLTIEATNRKVRENAEHKKLAAEVDRLAEASAESTKAIAYLDEQKQKLVQSAKFPIPELSFDDNGVTYNGIPFAQASGAEQLKASIAIGAALNPRLRILLCREGSILDNENMKAVNAFAKEKDMQVWLETCNASHAATVIIDDGEVKES